MENEANISRKETTKRWTTILASKKHAKSHATKNSLDGGTDSDATPSQDGSDTKKRKNVSFDEKKSNAGKKFSIEEEIKRRSLEAQRKSVYGNTAKPTSRKLLQKQSSTANSDEKSTDAKEISPGKKTSEHSSLAKNEKEKKTKQDGTDSKRASGSDSPNKNDKSEDLGGKSKRKFDSGKKSLAAKPTKSSAKKGKGVTVQVEEHDEVSSEPYKAKLKNKKSTVLKDKKTPSKTKKSNEDIHELKGKKTVKGLSRKGSSDKNSVDKEKTHGQHDHHDHHTEPRDRSKSILKEKTSIEEDDTHHHHHVHHHHAGRRASTLKKKVSFSEHSHSHQHLPHTHDSSEEHHHSSHEGHHHHHPHHHDIKKDLKPHIHLHAHKTREQRTWVTEMRGYSSEPVLPLPFDKKFTTVKDRVVVLKPYMKKLKKKYLSMDDIFLSHDGYPHLLREDEVDRSIKTYAVREEMLRSWDELFEMERHRFSFFDELFAKGYVLDSLEVPCDENNRAYLVAAEDKDMRSTLEFGRAVFKTKNIYTGEFKDKHFDGLGRYQWIDGTIYEGYFKKGIMHGHGKIEWEDGSLYEGEFVEGNRTGWGIYSTIQGYTYVGNWANGLPHGAGKMWYDIKTDNSDYYDGNWENGVQEGVGTRQYANGDRYIGKFSGGIRNGKGTMIWLKERQVYKGNWVNGVPQGLGTHIWYLTRTNTSSFPARHIYRGQWLNGKRDGIGKMIYPCGSVYEGRWKDGQRFAKGIFVNPAGELLFGLFRAGSVCGGTEVPLHAPPYDCDYAGLIEWINMKFHLDEVDNVDLKLQKLVTRHLELFRKLYKRAGQLGQSWGNNGLFPSWLKKGYHFEDYRDELEIMNMEDSPHMKGKNKKPHSPDNVYPVFRFGLWLLIKDISGLLDNVTMAHYDNLWSECNSLSFQTLHNPFEPVYLWQFLQCLIIISVSYYVDGPNRKYKLRMIPEERKRKISEEMEKVIKNKSPSPVIVEEKEETVDPCLQYMRDHNLLQKEEEFEDDEEDEYIDAVDDEVDDRMVISENENFEDNDETIEKSQMTLKQRFERYYKNEEGGEGYYDEAFPSQIDLDPNLDTVDDDDYSSVTYSSDRGSKTSIESADVDEEIPMTIVKAFEKLINVKFLKVLKRPPGKHLPKVPDPLPSISDLYYAFKSINTTDVISGAEFLKSTVPHDTFPNSEQTIYWQRSKEKLSVNVDLSNLFENFERTFTPAIDEENTLGEEFLGSTINTAESFTSKIKIEAEPEFERSHATVVEILKNDRKNYVFNKSQDSGKDAYEESSAALDQKYRREKFVIVRDPDEMFQKSNPFDDADLASEPFLYRQTRTCDWIQRKPFSKKSLSAHDVTRVFRRLYPKLTGAHHKSNIPSKMVFCDWLWCISLCSRISADREYLTFINEQKTMRPRLFHTAPHIGIHSPTEIAERWKHRNTKLGNTLYYLGEKKELQHVATK